VLKILLNDNNEPVWINPAQIVSVHQGVRNTIEIRMSNGAKFVAKHELPTLLQALGTPAAPARK
jgi:hypothetical protein